MADTITILVADKLADAGLEKLNNTPNVEVQVKVGLSESELAEAIQHADGMIVRSGAKVTAKVLENPGKLKCIARAGVGVDNVDLEAATAKGILVMNTPDANTISTAEHTIGMMFAVARNVPIADKYVRDGEFKKGRSSCVGVQLTGKTLGVIGMGRIGRAVAERAIGLGMKVVGFDPFIREDLLIRDEFVTMFGKVEDILGEVDFLTVHTPLTEQTRHIINAERIQSLKPTARLINVARGGLYEEAAVAQALSEGRLGGLATDVFEEEPPPADHPLLTAPNVVITPHLGASTREAQEAVAEEAVDAVVNYLTKDEIRSAVNVAGLPKSLNERERRYIDLVQRLARIAGPLILGGVKRIRVHTTGKNLEQLGGPLSRFAAIEILRPTLQSPPNLINVDMVAQNYDIDLGHRHSAEGESSGSHRVRVEVSSEDGEVNVTGSVYMSVDKQPRVINISGYPTDLVPEGALLMVFNMDMPGVVGQLGNTLGENGVNIADMTLSRTEGKAMMILKVDGTVPEDVMKKLAALPNMRHVHQVMLPPLMS